MGTRVLGWVPGLILLTAGHLNGLSQQPLFSKKDGKTNHFAVTVSAVSIERGGSVDEQWLNGRLFNSVCKVHQNGVIELKFPTGLRSFSVAGAAPRARIKQAGALFPRGWTTETIDGVDVTHVQARSVWSTFWYKARQWWPIEYDWEIPIEPFHLDQLDQYLLDVILSGEEKETLDLIKTYPHKINFESPSGRTVYLRLDNPLSDGTTILRCKGVMPRRKWFGRLSTYPTMDRTIVMKDGVAAMRRTKNIVTPAGTMALRSALNEFTAAHSFDGDFPMAVGKYRLFHNKDQAGFIIYGMKEDDTRILCVGRNNVWRNNQTNELTPVGPEGPAFFREVGKSLRDAHGVGIIHRAFHLGNIGYSQERNRKRPVFKDFEDTFRLPVDTNPHKRAGWMFVDLAWPIAQWSRSLAPGIDVEDYARQLLEGYFGGYVSKEVLRECLDPDFGVKLDSMAGAVIPIQIDLVFPHLYQALISVSLFEFNGTIQQQIERLYDIQVKLNTSS